MNRAESLRLHAEIMAVIDRKRAEANDPNLGAAIERFLIDSHCREVERDIFDNPGAMEPWLVRRRSE